MIVGADECARLAAVVGDRSRPLKHIQRARIVLFSAERLPVLDVARRACKFRANAVRLQLHALAYNLANFMRTLAFPKAA